MITNKEPSTLKSHIGYQLRLVSNAVLLSFAKKLAIYDVTVAEWVILREMYAKNEIISSSMIAEFTGLTRGAVSKLIERLVNKNLITRSESKIDRRYHEIKLTTSATELVPILATIADENDQLFFAKLSSVEQKTLTDLLIKLSHIHQLSTNPIK